MGVPYKKLASIAAVAAVVGSAVLSQNAFAAGTATWTGGSGAGNSFSIAANWEGGTLPTTGDVLVLPCASEELTLTNDLSDVKFSGITMQVSNTNDCKAITVDKVDFTDDITLKRKNGYSSSDKISLLSITSATGAANSISLGDKNGGEWGPSLGSVTLTTKNLKLDSFDYKDANINNLSNIRPTEALELRYADVKTLESYKSLPGKRIISGSLILIANTYKGDLTFAEGSLINTSAAFTWNNETGEYEVAGTESELSGKLTLLGNASYFVAEGASLKLTGSIEGKNFAIKAVDSSWGDFENVTTSDNSNTIKGKQEFEAKEVDLKSLCKDNRDYFTIGRNQVGTLADDSGCKSGRVTIDGLLKGVGTVEDLLVNGTLAPGNSPGTITVTKQLYFNTNLSVFDVEILNKDAYDKVIVGKDFTPLYTDHTAVNITQGTTLKLSYLSGGQIKKGDQLMIIDNQSSTDVKGTFKDMPEGAEVIVSGAVFKISYKGGDGNDVVLTAQNDSVGPKAPNTGAESLVTNPAVAAIAGIAGLVVFAIARRKF